MAVQSAHRWVACWAFELAVPRDVLMAGQTVTQRADLRADRMAGCSDNCSVVHLVYGKAGR